MHAKMKLGRTKRPDGRKFAKLADHLCRPLPPAPPRWDGTKDCVFPMFANDQIGDCTIAGLAHLLHMQAAAEGRSLQFTDEQVRAYYFHLSKGKDAGLVEVDVLDFAKTCGFPLDGAHKVAAWVAVDHTDLDTLKSAAALFGGIYMGAELPVNAQEQEEWDVHGGFRGNAAPGSWGGHCMVVGQFDARGLSFVTWGTLKRATWEWWHGYVDEAYVLLDADRAQVYGVDWTGLMKEIQSAGGVCVVPDVVPVPTPDPVPPPAPPAPDPDPEPEPLPPAPDPDPQPAPDTGNDDPTLDPSTLDDPDDQGFDFEKMPDVASAPPAPEADKPRRRRRT